MDVYEISVVTEGDPSAFNEVVSNGLHAFNEANVGPYRYAPLALCARVGAEIVGGATGGVHLGWLSLDVLWVAEGRRGKGLGSRLLLAIETEARRIGAHRAYLDTMAFQAAPFYARHGYVEEGRLVDFADGHDRIYMTKRSL